VQRFFYKIMLTFIYFQDAYVPGILYHVIGVMGVLCALGSLTLPETKDQYLTDKLNKHKVTDVPVQDKVV